MAAAMGPVVAEALGGAVEGAAAEGLAGEAAGAVAQSGGGGLGKAAGAAAQMIGAVTKSVTDTFWNSKQSEGSVFSNGDEVAQASPALNAENPDEDG